MLIFESITVPRFVLSCIIMHPRRESLPFYKNDSFWEGIIVLLMNPNQYFAANFNYFFSILTPLLANLVPLDLHLVELIIYSSHPTSHSCKALTAIINDNGKSQGCVYGLTIASYLSSPNIHIIHWFEIRYHSLLLRDYINVCILDISYQAWDVGVACLGEYVKLMVLQELYYCWISIDDSVY